MSQNVADVSKQALYYLRHGSQLSLREEVTAGRVHDCTNQSWSHGSFTPIHVEGILNRLKSWGALKNLWGWGHHVGQRLYCEGGGVLSACSTLLLNIFDLLCEMFIEKRKVSKTALRLQKATCLVKVFDYKARTKSSASLWEIKRINNIWLWYNWYLSIYNSIVCYTK
jgi:hypothetical protein